MYTTSKKELVIRKERISKDWTQQYIADNIELTRTAVHDIETGKQQPSFKVLKKLLKLFRPKAYEEVEALFAVADDTHNLSM